MRNFVNPRVGAMLDALKIDYLGVSIDALLIIAPEDQSREIQGYKDCWGCRRRHRHCRRAAVLSSISVDVSRTSLRGSGSPPIPL